MLPQFVRRRNRDGTVDSICTLCFMTAAKAEREAELHEMEAFHRCMQPLPERWVGASKL
jgi:hypothetical protein